MNEARRGESGAVRVPSALGRRARQALGNRLAPVIVVGLMAVGAIVPFVFLAPHHPDEDQYAWSAGYYGKKLLAGDFSGHGTDLFVDPGWNPDSYWGRSMGTRAVMAIGLVLPWAHAPERPYSYTVPALQGPDTRLDRSSLIVLRLLAALCAVVGAVLLAVRLGWVGTLSVAVILVVPHNAENFGRAWASGPLLLACGVVAVAYGSRWFPLILGAASTVKFTLVGLWPLALIRAAHGWRSRALALTATVATWVVLTPPSWYWGGPAMVLKLADVRVAEYEQTSAVDGGPFLPSRYFWPFELALALLALGLVARRKRAWQVVQSTSAPGTAPVRGEGSSVCEGSAVIPRSVRPVRPSTKTVLWTIVQPATGRRVGAPVTPTVQPSGIDAQDD